MARPRKLLATNRKNFTKEEIAAREAEEEILNKFTQIDIDEVPSFLDIRARDEWFRIVPLLKELPISELDRTQIAQYCHFVSLYEQCAKEVEYYGLIVDDRPNPAYKMMIDAAKEIKTISNSMGLTINSRMKLVAPVAAGEEEKEKDQFARFEDD